MRHLLISLIVPLTIISFWCIGKWWYALPEDAPDTMYTGFPLIYSGAGWHTSLSYQIFITELIIDILVYFVFWFLIVFLIKRFKKEFKVAKIITFFLWIATFILLIIQTVLLTVSDNVYHVKRPYPIQVIKTGIEFGWEISERPDYNNYFPKER